MSLMIEKRIWEYIDGSCSLQDAKDVAGLIQTDPEYAALYQELTALNESMEGFELDEPSMSFNRNLMEKISAEPVPGSLKSLIDKRIINGIAGFFLVTIFALVLIAILKIDWSGAYTLSITGSSTLKLPNLNLSSSTSNVLLTGLYFFDAILGLYLLDMWLRRPEKIKKIIHNT